MQRKILGAKTGLPFDFYLLSKSLSWTHKQCPHNLQLQMYCLGHVLQRIVVRSGYKVGEALVVLEQSGVYGWNFYDTLNSHKSTSMNFSDKERQILTDSRVRGCCRKRRATWVMRTGERVTQLSSIRTHAHGS